LDFEIRTLVIGTRGSKLAVWQAEHVARKLQDAFSGLRVEIERIRTTGDKILDVPLAQVGGKALFVKEIEEALLEGRVDLAVHSMKDVPTDLPDGLAIRAILEREDPRDALISRTGAGLADLARGARVGTSSLRRQAQLLHCRPDLVIIGLRGNLDTRVRKLASEGLDAIVLAIAGVKRLGLEHLVTEILSPEVLLPAVGQGALGVEVRVPNPLDTVTSPLGGERAGEASVAARELSVAELAKAVDHPQTHLAVRAERAFLRRLGGGCQVPIAGCATLEGEAVLLQGLVASPDGQSVVRGEIRGRRKDPDVLGTALAEELLERGAEAILQRIVGGKSRG
jgi:hydroxymethylbilane synthase